MGSLNKVIKSFFVNKTEQKDGWKTISKENEKPVLGN